MAAGKRGRLSQAFLFFKRLRRPFLTHREKEKVAQALREAEKKTSAEIHVHISRRFGRRAPLEAAERTFARLGLHKTEKRNGVLILISDLDRRFVVWGDAAVHKAVGDAAWTAACEVLSSHFKKEEYAEGLVQCVNKLGEILSEHYSR